MIMFYNMDVSFIVFTGELFTRLFWWLFNGSSELITFVSLFCVKMEVALSMNGWLKKVESETGGVPLDWFGPLPSC